MLDQIEKIQSDFKKKEETPFLQKFAYFWSRVVVLYVFAISFLPINPESKEYVNFSLGFLLGTGAATILNYFYGTSAGNRSKDNTMALLAGSLNLDPSTETEKECSQNCNRGSKEDLKSNPDVKAKDKDKDKEFELEGDLDGDGDVDADDLDIARARSKLQATDSSTNNQAT